jgi:hypothetical protein
MLEWLKVGNAKAMELIERSMHEAGVVHVMLEWLKVCNTKAMELIKWLYDGDGYCSVI